MMCVCLRACACAVRVHTARKSSDLSDSGSFFTFTAGIACKGAFCRTTGQECWSRDMSWLGKAGGGLQALHGGRRRLRLLFVDERDDGIARHHRWFFFRSVSERERKVFLGSFLSLLQYLS